MFIGHHAAAFAAKRLAPRTQLAWLFVATTLLDLLWPVCLLLGIERATVRPHPPSPFLNLDFVSYPWTHSLLMTLLWSVLAALVYWLITHYTAGAVVIGIGVFSHWVLDWVTHIPDMPLWPGGPKYGLGLWKWPMATIVIESLMLIAGVIIYVRATRPRRRRGTIILAVLVVFLFVAYALSIVSPPPPSERALAWGGMVGWLLILWPWWADRNREAAR
ncbi:MAG TPA: metal-dependent hydrolase [Thermoanaerobaculia bacterium]|nr:metal-dependent hydrolase [Thermoanaerobaculia bacterium]